MVAVANPARNTADAEPLQARFLTLLPRLELHGRIYFRNLRCQTRREEAVAEMVALAWKWFLRLHERGKDVNRFQTTFVLLVLL